MIQQQLTFEQRVDDRITALLARCEGVRRGSDISKPVVFDARGQRHARAVAAADGRTVCNTRSTLRTPTESEPHLGPDREG